VHVKRSFGECDQRPAHQFTLPGSAPHRFDRGETLVTLRAAESRTVAQQALADQWAVAAESIHEKEQVLGQSYTLAPRSHFSLFHCVVW
jgi:hypothetical protein